MDAFLDIINYMVLLEGLIRERIPDVHEQEVR